MPEYAILLIMAPLSPKWWPVSEWEEFSEIKFFASGCKLSPSRLNREDRCRQVSFNF